MGYIRTNRDEEEGSEDATCQVGGWRQWQECRQHVRVEAVV